jgi:hypothetical protein
MALANLGTIRALLVVTAVLLSITWLVVAVLFGDVPSRDRLVNRMGGVAGGDLMYFYPAGKLAAAGQPETVYDPAALTATARSMLRPDLPELVWPYPPTTSLAVLPLGWLSPRAALITWLGAMMIGTLGVGRLAFGSWRLTPLVLLFPGTGFALFTGQLSPVVAFTIAAFFLQLERSPRLAGIALGLLAWKPQFAMGPGAGLLARREWRAVGSACATGGAIVVASILALGLEPWRRFGEALVRHSQVLDRETPMSRFITVFAAAHADGLGLTASLVVHALVAVPACVVAFRLWRDASRASTRALGLVSATLVVTPYALDYDFLLLLLPWCLLIAEVRRSPETARQDVWLWLCLTAIVPTCYVVEIWTQHSVGAIFILVLLAAMGWQDLRRRTSDTRPISS